MRLESLQVKHASPTVAVWLLGVMWFVSSTLKAFGFLAFAHSLVAYDIQTSLSQVVIASMIVTIEGLLGLALLFRVEPRVASIASGLLLLLFVCETFLHRDAVHASSCGCFGIGTGTLLGGSTPFLHQAIAIFIAVVGSLDATRVPAPRYRMAVSGIALAAAITGFVLAGNRTAFDHEDQVRILLSATCPHCRAALPQVRTLLKSGARTLPVRVYIGAIDGEQLKTFWGDSQPSPTPLSMRQLGSLTSSVPAVQIIRNGRIESRWIGVIPNSIELSSAEHIAATKSAIHQ